MRRAILSVCLAGVVVLMGFTAIDTPRASAGALYGRQYYGGWSYNEINHYHYRQYFYKPYVSAPSYSYHYVVYYPQYPQYYYYYNPVKRYYWGRYDKEAKGYSLLAEADRKQKLEDIKESAFPKPGAMPSIPESEDKVAMEVPPDDAPKTVKK